MNRFLMAMAMAFSSMAFAENTPFVNFLGYSDDAKFLAFQETVIADGSGNYLSSIRILDTAADKYMEYSAPELSDELDMNGEWGEQQEPMPFSEFTTKAQQKAAGKLKKYGIKKSNGKQLMVSVGPRISGISYNGKYISVYRQDRHVDMPAARYEQCLDLTYGGLPGIGENKWLGYAITVSNADVYKTGYEPQTIHEDTRIPSSRGCPTGYSMNSAFAFVNQVTVLVAVETVGFEGPDVSFITAPFDVSKDIK